jgi:catecholate siderophore receptor
MAAVSISGGSTALVAQTGTRAPGPPPAGQSLPVVRFAIPAGTLSDGIAAFERASGWKVQLSNEQTATLAVKAVVGMMPPEQALRAMLAGTGLRYRMTGRRGAVVEIGDVQTSVDVVERAPLASPRYTEPIRNLPQTITVIPHTVMEQQGATSLTEVLRNVPGMTITAGEGGAAAGDNLTLRGNSARNDIFVDGVRDLSPQSRDPFNLEQVEVTKGPTSAITGRGSAGGAINLISKGPGVSRMLGGSLALGNADTRRATVDVNAPMQRFGLGERTALRFNALVHNAGVAGRNAVTSDRWGLAPSLAFGLGTPTRLTLSYYKLKQDNISDYGIPWVPATSNALAGWRDNPAPVPRETFYGYRERDREVLNQDTGTVKFEHDFSDRMQLQTQLRIGDSGRNSIATPPRLASSETTVINRELRSWVTQDRIVDNQTDLRADFRTGGVAHTAVAGAAFTAERNTRITRTGPNASTTLLNPNPDDRYSGVITTGPNAGKINGNTQSLWAFDTAKLGRKWEATSGVRWEHFNVNGVNTTPAVVAQDVRFASLRAGLIYKPTRLGSIYASYGTSVSPSLEGLSYNTSNTAIPPEETYTSEIGTKWEVGGRRLLLAGALFQVKKDNARTPALLPTDPPQVLAGRQVSQGLELSASGAITRSLRVLGSYTLIDARIRSSNTMAEVGKRFQNTPRNAASMWITYATRKFTLGVGPRFMGKRYGNNTNTRYVDGYGTVDVTGSYAVHRHLDLRLNVSNLNDVYYFERLGGGHLIPGPSRYVMVTTNFRF